jgi:hypothetical protein
MAILHFPCELCKNFELKGDCEWRFNICPESFLEANTACPAAKSWVFKKSDPHEKCNIHGIVPKVSKPVHDTGRLLIWSGLILSGMGMKETPDFPEYRRAEYLNALVNGGINTMRDFITCIPGDEDDPLSYWQFDDPELLELLKSRMKLVQERDLTQILTLQPYCGTISDDQVRYYIRNLKEFLPNQNLIFEPINEPRNNDRQREIVKILLDSGVPKENIAIEFVDSSDWVNMFNEFGLIGKSFFSKHWMGSMETVKEIFGGSSAQTLLGWGKFFGSCDGMDEQGKAKGLNFWHNAQAGIDNRRPDNNQLHDIVKWFLTNGGCGYEMLSASGYQHSAWPNMDDMILIGHDERQAMSSATE